MTKVQAERIITISDKTETQIVEVTVYYKIDTKEEKSEPKKNPKIILLQKRCSFNKTGPYPFPQRIYYCKKCDQYICQNCKDNCPIHKSHKLNDLGYTDEFYCQCSHI